MDKNSFKNSFLKMKMSSIAKVKLEDLHPQFKLMVVEDLEQVTSTNPPPPTKPKTFTTSDRKSPKRR
jgi:hypothetical protein